MLPDAFFDFEREPPGGRRLAGLLAILGLALAADVTHEYLSSRATFLNLAAEVSRVLADRRAVPADDTRTASKEEREAARQVAAALTTPWESLFAALERVMPQDVTLASIEPDSSSRVVVLTGDAKDYLSILNYVEALRIAGFLREVRLTHHETNMMTRRIAFSIRASWADR